MPVRGMSGMQSPSRVCTLSTSHTDSALSSLGKAAYGYWAYAAGLKIPPSQFFAPAEEAPLFCLRALLHQRLSPRRRSHVPRSHRYRPSASLLTASPRNTHTTRSSGALFTRNHWKHSSWDAWHSTRGQISPCFNKMNPANIRSGGVWVFRTVCFERVVLSSPGCLWPGRMDDHEEVFEAHA